MFTGLLLTLAISLAPAIEKPNKSVDLASMQSVPSLQYGAGGIFGSLEIRTNLKLGKNEWSDMLKRLKVEAPQYGKCDQGASVCNKRVVAWRRGIQRARSFSSNREKLNYVNSMINRLIRYKDDAANFGKADYWATPMQSISGQGDCEDYAIAKFLTLSELGFSPRDMKMVIVKDTRRRIGHAVLAVKLDNRTVILDNLNNRLTPHTKISWYKPIYSINRAGSWMNIAVKIRKNNNNS